MALVVMAGIGLMGKLPADHPVSRLETPVSPPLTVQAAETPTLSLRQLQRENGSSVTYYAVGDEFLETAFTLLDDYWSSIANSDRSLLQGHVDTYLPVELRDLSHEPASAMMAAFAESFFAARNPQTGLIPYSYDVPIPANPQRPAEAELTSGGKQPVGLIHRAVEFCDWFPDDLNLQSQCAALGQSTIRYFDVAATNASTPNGLWGWVDAASGATQNSLTLTHDYGYVGLGMSALSKLTADPQYLEWADQKLTFVWDHPLSTNLPLLQEQFVLTEDLVRPDEFSSDTDTLYFVRHLFELFEATQNPQYRDWAMAVTDLWFKNAWNPQWGHFLRKLNPDGTPAVDTLYGDGKFNTLYMLIHAYHVTQDETYLQRLKLAWNNLVQMGWQGLVPETVRQGSAVVESGLDPEQTLFLDILMEAYEASSDRFFLTAAETLGQNILKQGPGVMRLESGQAGQAFLKLALAHQPISRVKLTVAAPGTPLEITQNGKTILEVEAPTRELVLYLPAGPYQVITG